MLQLPVVTLALQLWVPSLTVTVHVGAPLPGTLADTVKLKLTAWPTAVDVLVAKFPSPGQLAVTLCAPAELNAMLQLPAATLALQLWLPSLTVTVAVVVPLPGTLDDTVKLKLTAWPTADGLGVW